MFPRIATLCCTALAALALTACLPGGNNDEDDPDDPADMGPADAAPPDAALPTVPYEGQIDALPAESTVDAQSFFPVPEGGVWRYRRQTAQWQDPPPVTEGGEAVLLAGDAEGEFVRRTVVVIDLEVDGEVQKVRQIIEETYVVEPPEAQAGPRIKFKALDIEERTVDGGLFVRTVSRTYDPPYDLFPNAWLTGMVGTRVESDMVRMTEVVQRRGEEEAEPTEGLVPLLVLTDSTPKIEPMECAYREGLYQIDVTDDFTNTISRTYWVEQGLGVVKWQYRDTNNIAYTLTESNVDDLEGTTCDAAPDDEAPAE